MLKHDSKKKKKGKLYENYREREKKKRYFGWHKTTITKYLYMFVYSFCIQMRLLLKIHVENFVCTWEHMLTMVSRTCGYNK